MAISVFNIPNTLTIVRISLIPVFITMIIYREYDYALYLFIIAAVTDVFDGLFARLKNQRTVLGAFLDPIADKFLLVTSYIVLGVYGLIPKWLTITVISRDIIIVIGWLLLYFALGISKIEPSLLGKITIWVQSILVAYVLIKINFNLFPDASSSLFIITAAVTMLSGIHYVFRGLKQTHAG